MIELGVGFHPELTGRENVFLNAVDSRPDARRDRARSTTRVVEYSGLEHFIDVPIKNYSSGMHMRLGFAIAANLDPDILLLDEIFAVGDADFQQRCIETVNRFIDAGQDASSSSRTRPSAIRAICQRVCVLEQRRAGLRRRRRGGLEFYEELLRAPPRPPIGPAAAHAVTALAPFLRTAVEYARIMHRYRPHARSSR